MAPLAAKWGRLWQALSGQARLGLEACGLPTNSCSTCWVQQLPLAGEAQTLWFWLSGETCALQESQTGPMPRAPL